MCKIEKGNKILFNLVICYSQRVIDDCFNSTYKIEV